MAKDIEYWAKIQAYATIVLVLITGYYAYSSSGMLDIMSKDYELQSSYFEINQPYISVEGLEIIENKYVEEGFYLKINLKNRGDYPARINRLETSFLSDILIDQSIYNEILLPKSEKEFNVFLKKNQKDEFQKWIDERMKGGYVKVKVYYTDTSKNENSFCSQSGISFGYEKLVSKITPQTCD